MDLNININIRFIDGAQQEALSAILSSVVAHKQTLLGLAALSTAALDKVIRMDQIISDLAAAVADEGTVIEGVVTLLSGIADRLSKVVDISEIPGITSAINAHKKALADAVALVPPAPATPTN